MVQEAEQHAQQDADARAAAEERNAADTLAYTTEKALAESGDRISETDRATVQSALDDLRAAIEGDDPTRIRTAREHLEEVWRPVASSMYAQPDGTDSREPAAAGAGATGSGDGDDVVDAEFRSSDQP